MVNDQVSSASTEAVCSLGVRTLANAMGAVLMLRDTLGHLEKTLEVVGEVMSTLQDRLELRDQQIALVKEQLQHERMLRLRDEDPFVDDEG